MIVIWPGRQLSIAERAALPPRPVLCLTCGETYHVGPLQGLTEARHEHEARHEPQPVDRQRAMAMIGELVGDIPKVFAVEIGMDAVIVHHYAVNAAGQIEWPARGDEIPELLTILPYRNSYPTLARRWRTWWSQWALQ